MLKLHRKNVQLIYTAIQSLFWLTYGLMFAFASVYLQGKGFSNGGIGIVLGCSYALSAILQPSIAALFARKGLATEQALSRIYAIIIVFSLIILLFPLPKIAAAPLIILIFSLESALQPSIDTLARQWTNLGYPVDYGVSRGFGSLLYAAMTTGMGLLLQKIATTWIPLFYLSTVSASVIILKTIQIPHFTGESKASSEYTSLNASSRSPRFLLFLAGISCLSLGHVMVDNFMLQIMQNINGNSANLGIAISIASLVEFPAMMMYSRLSKRFGVGKLLIFSAWAWLLKNLLVFLASSPWMIYLAEVLQFASYGIYIPASIEYIAGIFPGKKNLKGQSFAGSAYTIGSVLATFAGGMLLDLAGISITLMIMLVVTLMGACFFTIAVQKH